jgi:hypothetical protein
LLVRKVMSYGERKRPLPSGARLNENTTFLS